MTKTISKPDIKIEGINMASLTEKWCVEALNNNISTFQDVIKVLVNVCGHSGKDAKYLTVKIHKTGSAVVFYGGKDLCEQVILSFKKIGVECHLLEN